jgi:protein SCO1/2
MRAFRWLLLFSWLATTHYALAADSLRAGVFDPARFAPDFQLSGSNGTELRLSQFKGKIVLLGFGFTHCSDVCPVTLAVLASARRGLGEAAKDVQVLYITVDPDRDSVPRMKEYLTAFDQTFIGGTGTAAQLAKVRNEYGIVVGDKTVTGTVYSIAHSSYVYLIDRKGILRALIPYGSSPDDYIHDLRQLLQG